MESDARQTGCTTLPPLNGDGCYRIADFLAYLDGGCALPPEGGGRLCFSSSVVIVDKHGHELDGDFDPQGAGGCDHRDTPEWQSKHAEDSMAKEAKVVKAEQQEPAPAPEAPPLKAIVEQPAVTSAAHELSGIVGQDVTGMQVVMAVVAVGGGAAAWKFYTQRQKLKHEESMERMRQERESKDDQHKSCKAERASLEMKLGTVESRLAEVEKKGKSLDLGDFDPDEMQDELNRLKRQIRKLLAKEDDSEEKSDRRRRRRDDTEDDI